MARRIDKPLPNQFDLEPNISRSIKSSGNLTSGTTQTKIEGKFRALVTQGTIFDIEEGKNYIVSSNSEFAASSAFIEGNGGAVLDLNSSILEEEYTIKETNKYTSPKKLTNSFSIPFNNVLQTPLERADARFEADRAKRETLRAIVGDPTEAFAKLVQDIPPEILNKYFSEE